MPGVAEAVRDTVQARWHFSDLRALYVNCTLKRSPGVSSSDADPLRTALDGAIAQFQADAPAWRRRSSA